MNLSRHRPYLHSRPEDNWTRRVDELVSTQSGHASMLSSFSVDVYDLVSATDPYSRPDEKRGGAWMDEVAGQSKQFAPPGQKVRLPVAHMVSLKPFHVSQNRDSSLRHRPVLAAWRKAGWRLDGPAHRSEQAVCSGGAESATARLQHGAPALRRQALGRSQADVCPAWTSLENGSASRMLLSAATAAVAAAAFVGP